jgi:FkbM family methyltransferase
VEIVLRIAIVLLAGFAVLWTALGLYPGLAILPAAAAGLEKSPFCTTWQAVRDADIKTRQSRLVEDLRVQTRLVRTENGLSLWATPKGEFWAPGNNEEIVLILLAQQMRHIYGEPQGTGVRTGDIVLDGGAHIGVYVRSALDAGASKVVAIEPSPEPLECLRRNFAREIASGKVIVYPKGIWNEEKRLVFYSNGNGGAGDSFLERGERAKVVADIPVTTVDKIVSELQLPRVDLIKADIKGAGTRMINGAAGTIRAFHPRIVVSVEEAPEDPAAIRAALLQVDSKYRFRSGPCLFTGSEIRNDTIFFE